MKSSVPPEPKAFDVRPTRLRHAVSLGVFLQLLEVGGSCGILYPQGVLDNGHPAVQVPRTRRGHTFAQVPRAECRGSRAHR